MLNRVVNLSLVGLVRLCKALIDLSLKWSGVEWFWFLCLCLSLVLESARACSDWAVMRPRQWKADLIGLVLKQSKAPTTVSSQKNVKLNNTPLMMTKYSNVCMVTQSPGHHSHQCQTEQEQLCNTLVSSPHSWVLLFWQLGLWSAVTNRQNIQIYFLANLSWVAGIGKARRFVQPGYSFHFVKEASKKIPQCGV